MIAKTKIQITELYVGKTKFSFWSDLEVDDIVEILIPIKKSGGNRGSLYATSATVVNLRTKESFVSTMNDICNYLTKTEYKEL